MQRGALIVEGKTKRIYEADEPGMVVVEYKNDITAFDNPEFTKQFQKKAEYSNITNARVFEMLHAAGVPTSFVRQESATEFISLQCTMVPLEVVARRYAVGSYLNRHPEFAAQGDVPHRFLSPVIEFFLKTTKGSLKSAAGEMLVEGLDPLKGEEDPFIPNPDEREWKLAFSKKPADDPTSDLGRVLDRTTVLPSETAIAEMTDIIRKTFLTLESFFERHDFKFVDFKIEFGVTTDGKLVIADVIDNDSWRLRDASWKDVSKQSFRDGEDMASIEDKYERVAKLLDKSKK